MLSLQEVSLLWVMDAEYRYFKLHESGLRSVAPSYVGIDPVSPCVIADVSWGIPPLTHLPTDAAATYGIFYSHLRDSLPSIANKVGTSPITLHTHLRGYVA